ncbi:translation initiation factor eIF4A [Coemansia asiatica]|nr:translation initiation factor eIF4A [Coemansia asiatica]
MKLSENMLHGIYTYGLEKPTTIQQCAIVPILSNYNVIMEVLSDSSRLTAFAIPVLQRINPIIIKPQALVLAPNCELVYQIKEIMSFLGKFLNFKVHICTDGTPLASDKKAFKDGVHVVLGTPGHVFSLIKYDIFHTDSVKLFVLDEANKMILKGFENQIQKVFVRLPTKVQSMLLSATLHPDVLEVITKFMCNPIRIQTKE